MNIDIKILNKGDSVMNVFGYMDSIAISVKRNKGYADIVLLSENGDGIPEITSMWTISQGNNEVEIRTDKVKISTF